MKEGRLCIYICKAEIATPTYTHILSQYYIVSESAYIRIHGYCYIHVHIAVNDIHLLKYTCMYHNITSQMYSPSILCDMTYILSLNINFPDSISILYVIYVTSQALSLMHMYVSAYIITRVFRKEA